MVQKYTITEKNSHFSRACARQRRRDAHTTSGLCCVGRCRRLRSFATGNRCATILGTLGHVHPTQHTRTHTHRTHGSTNAKYYKRFRCLSAESVEATTHNMPATKKWPFPPSRAPPHTTQTERTQSRAHQINPLPSSSAVVNVCVGVYVITFVHKPRHVHAHALHFIIISTNTGFLLTHTSPARSTSSPASARPSPPPPPPTAIHPPPATRPARA